MERGQPAFLIHLDPHADAQLLLEQSGDIQILVLYDSRSSLAVERVMPAVIISFTISPSALASGSYVNIGSLRSL